MSWKSVNFDWNRARAFLVTAEEGSLSAAARALNMTQPTLGRQVAALEKELNVTLFERVNQGLVLTPSGVQLLEHVRQMGSAASAFSLSASGQEKALEGTVCISASEVDAVFRLPEIAEKVRKEEPGIVLEFAVSNEVSDLKKREADIALRSFRPSQPDLITRKLMQERIWFYGSPDYLKPYANMTTPQEVREIDIIGYDHGDQFKNALVQQGWPIENVNFPLVTRFWILQIELIKRGLGVTLLPEDVGDSIPELCRGFEGLGPFMTLDIWLVTHRELHTSRRVRRVFDLIVETLG
ncbi:LysR family transcriptional regulator [Reinekea blandensis]|uniref:Transcription regulator, LysR family protein n=1 Tax=Reinekea blandensis MED297 TaxID=314283 RepID=A4BEU2_9GAMM|nr:LysR family transcriptional regulator [Reinekea blandensis]EAR09277.1 transcription regulator, LysR family protein [Reinekea sp. MED297] [Reinekea blandensis MED297]